MGLVPVVLPFALPPAAMIVRRSSPWIAALLLSALALAGCEPYMSLTDRVPSQTREATALLPAAPRYAGMVDLETMIDQVDRLGGKQLSLGDSLRSADSPRLQAFLSATELDLQTDLKAVYGAVGEGGAFSAVVFADLAPAQAGRYLDRAPATAGRATTYRGVPIYHLALGPASNDAAPGKAAPDTLSVGFVRSGMIATATTGALVRAMVDRHKDEAGGFRENEPYMTLVERVGHGSTAWLVGRDVLQTALRDSAGEAAERPGEPARGASAMSGAGVQQLLSAWADRMLGVPDGGLDMPDDGAALEGQAGRKMKRLTSQVREQALSVTLTDQALEGEAYLTMRDKTSAANVVDLSKGAMAALRLSGDASEDGWAGLLREVSVERDGPVVHAQFAVERGRLRRAMQDRGEERAVREANPSTRRAHLTVRRSGGIMRGGTSLEAVPDSDFAGTPYANQAVSFAGTVR